MQVKIGLRSHYKKNKRYYMDKAATGRAKLIEWYRTQKAHPCMDCGHTYPYYVMDFDHRDPQTKKHNVSELVAQGRKKKLEQELAKCDLVCANCHRERTHRASPRARP